MLKRLNLHTPGLMDRFRETRKTRVTSPLEEGWTLVNVVVEWNPEISDGAGDLPQEPVERVHFILSNDPDADFFSATNMEYLDALSIPEIDEVHYLTEA